MIEITAAAGEQLKKYLQFHMLDNTVRITTTHDGCTGFLRLVPEQGPLEGDAVFRQEGVTFLVDRQLLICCGGITLDYATGSLPRGFVLNSVNPLPGLAETMGSGAVFRAAAESATAATKTAA